MRFIHHCKKLFLSLGKIGVIILLIIAPFVGLNAAYPQFLDHLDDIVSQHPLTCTLFRWSAYSSIFLMWPVLFRHIGRVKYWSREEVDYWVMQRTRIMFWFLAWELIVGENIFLIIFNHWKV